MQRKMRNIKAIIAAVAITISTAACNKDKVEKPAPDEQELITTVKLIVTNATGFNQTFTYKVENGFDASTPGIVTQDSLILDANNEYNVEVRLLNEKANPSEDVTNEVISEKDEHLFLFASAPVNGNGSINFADGSKDNAGKPFNQKVVFKTGPAGNGTLTLVLKHQPTNKESNDLTASGGDTDMQAMFHVRIR